jgi:type II secretory ATPase GspE/PulE/Tfp pilus assembly ATPase PilB-like protein
MKEQYMPSTYQRRGGPDHDQTELAPYPDLLNTLIWNAIMDRATDVHLHGLQDGLRVMHRVDGVVHPKMRLSPAEGKRLLNQLKSASGLSVTRSFSPLEGQIAWRDGDAKWEIRVTLTPVRNRESVHLRFLSSPKNEWDISRLGLGGEDLERVAAGMHSLNGLVLITGATGSGKTTTMYSLASMLDLRCMTTYSIEDPVEFRLSYAQQIEVDERHGLTMHEGLRTILRMDPDLILVGEIRDSDSAMVAARAALSGRLVLATIHSQDAAGTVDALHYLGVPHHIIAGSLRLIIAQSLVRRLCSCCVPHEGPSPEAKELFARYGMAPPESLLHAQGCSECNWYGYKGRTGVFEVVTVDDEIRGLIHAGVHHRELADCLRGKGIASMAHDGLRKAAAGITSIEEVSRACGLAASAEPTRELTHPIAVAVTAG